MSPGRARYVARLQNGSDKEAERERERDTEWSGVELEKGQRIDFLVGGEGGRQVDRSNEPTDRPDDACSWQSYKGKCIVSTLNTF